MGGQGFGSRGLAGASGAGEIVGGIDGKEEGLELRCTWVKGGSLFSAVHLKVFPLQLNNSMGTRTGRISIHLLFYFFLFFFFFPTWGFLLEGILNFDYCSIPKCSSIGPRIEMATLHLWGPFVPA